MAFSGRFASRQPPASPGEAKGQLRLRLAGGDGAFLDRSIAIQPARMRRGLRGPAMGARHHRAQNQRQHQEQGLQEPDAKGDPRVHTSGFGGSGWTILGCAKVMTTGRRSVRRAPGLAHHQGSSASTPFLRERGRLITRNPRRVTPTFGPITRTDNSSSPPVREWPPSLPRRACSPRPADSLSPPGTWSARR